MEITQEMIMSSRKPLILSKVLNIGFLTEEDQKIINTLIEMLKNETAAQDATFCRCDFYDLVKNALKDLTALGDLKLVERINNNLPNVAFLPMILGTSGYACNINFLYKEKEDGTKVEEGKTNNYKVPLTPDARSHILLGHEFVHSLKDTNYKEYLFRLRFADVITIFYELLASDRTDKESELFTLRERKKIILDECDTYANARLLQQTTANKEELEYIANRSGQYVNSFYYALLLYEMYKQSPKYILKEVRRVLNQEITTYDLLKKLNLLHEDKFELFETEYQTFAKRLKS